MVASSRRAGPREGRHGMAKKEKKLAEVKVWAEVPEEYTLNFEETNPSIHHFYFRERIVHN